MQLNLQKISVICCYSFSKISVKRKELCYKTSFNLTINFDLMINFDFF